jgi:hypothetical protein
MSRTPDPGFDPRIADWLEADPNLAPPDVMRTVESAIPSIPQRRALRLPWRTLPVNRPILIFASLALLTVLGVGAVAVGSRPSTTTPTPAPVPTAPAAVEASPDAPPAVTGAAYATARDAVCRSASAAAEPIKARLGPLYEPDSTEAQRSDAIAAVRSYADLADGIIADLAALEVPPELVAEDAASVAQYRDILILIRASLALHDKGRTAEAIAVDLATDGIGAQITRFEQRHGLWPCP